MPRERSRDLKKETFWRRMIGGQARSGLSISGWCRRHALQESGFHWWRRELSRRDAGQPRRRPRRRTSSFVPVRIAGPSAPAESNQPACQIEIVLSGDRRVRVIGPVDRRALADVLMLLEAPPC
jgi:transposase-like protein